MIQGTSQEQSPPLTDIHLRKLRFLRKVRIRTFRTFRTYISTVTLIEDWWCCLLLGRQIHKSPKGKYMEYIELVRWTTQQKGTDHHTIPHKLMFSDLLLKLTD